MVAQVVPHVPVLPKKREKTWSRFQTSARHFLKLKARIDATNTSGGKKFPRKGKTIADMRTSDQQAIIERFKRERLYGRKPDDMSDAEATRIIFAEMHRLSEEQIGGRYVWQQAMRGITT